MQPVWIRLLLFCEFPYLTIKLIDISGIDADSGKKNYIGKKTMKHIFLIPLACIASFSLAFSQARDSATAENRGTRTWAQHERYVGANTALTKAPKAVFFGDSITDGWAESDPEFFSSNNFAGRGISGQTTSQMLVRLRADVIALKPQYMVLLAGINDIAMNNGPVELEHVMENIVSMVELVRLHKIKPVLCLVFPTREIKWRMSIGDPTEQIVRLNAMISSYAKANKIPCVEYFADIDKSSGNLPASLSADSIHPNLEGYRIMEEEILKYIK